MSSLSVGRKGKSRWGRFQGFVAVDLERFFGDGGSIASHVVDAVMRWEQVQVGRRRCLW